VTPIPPLVELARLLSAAENVVGIETFACIAVSKRWRLVSILRHTYL
jgi:hypothetical protein